MSDRFAADWLSLREPFDAAARDAALAQRFIAALPRRPWLIDLGAGTGSLFRDLAPRIGGEQHWTLIDADAALLEEGFNVIAAWAVARGYELDPGADTLAIHTPSGVWRIDGELHDLADMPGQLPLAAADAVVCSALLDLVSRPWLDALAGALRQPFYATLTADGRDVWRPAHALDRRLRAFFRRDQGRDKGFGPALGPHAVAAAEAAFAARGFAVATAASDWVMDADALAMAHALIGALGEVALRWEPRQASAIAAWDRLRHRQAMRGRLAIRIGHRDILALPPAE
jgi:SAM-dependent methyltransferase